MSISKLNICRTTAALLRIFRLRNCGIALLFVLAASVQGFGQNILSPEIGATNQNYKQVVLQWADSTHSYRIFVGTDSVSWGIMDTVVTGSYLVVSNLLPSTTYFWKLQAVNDTSNVSGQTSWFTTGHYLTFQNFKFIPAIDSVNYVSESSSHTITFTDSIDIGKTALILCDVWASAADSNVVNIVTMLNVARKHNIPVFLFNHDGPLYPTVLLKPWDVSATISAIPDTMLSRKGLTTLLYTGGDASECVLFTRPISINTLSLKFPNTYKIIGIKDCIISWSQLAYNWGINAVETKFQTTLLTSLASALGESVSTLTVQRPSLLASINYDSTFGPSINPAQTALVVVNAWSYFPNAGWLARVQNNNRNNIAPLIKWARNFGIRVFHIANGQAIDSSCAPLGSELTFNDKTSLYTYLKSKGIKQIIFCGNLINTVNAFAPMDAWGMTRYPTGFNNVPGFFSSRLLSDCFTVFETPSTLANEVNKSIYLERAATQTFDTLYLVSSSAILRKNIPAKIISTPLFVAHEDSIYRDTVVSQTAFLDNTLRYALLIKPSWLRINNLTGIIYGTPGANNVGDTTVTIQLSNGAGQISTQSYTLTVLHTNHNPKIITAPDSTATEDSPYKYRVIGVDRDTTAYLDVIRYRLSLKPSWLSIDSVAGVISGLPSGMNARDTVVAVQAYDNKGGTATQQFTLHVAHVNHAPRILSLANTLAQQDTAYSYRFIATDQDSALWGDRIAYSFQIHPSWTVIDSISGVVTGTPRGNNIGDTTVTVVASDGKGGTATQSYALHVIHTNHSPVIKTSSLPPATEDTLYQSRVYASDQDSTLFGDVVHYRLIKPAWLAIDSTTGIFFGTPHVQNAFDTVVVLQAYDGHGGLAQHQYSLTITLVNHAPTIVSLPLFTAHEDTLYQYTVVAHDPDTLIGQVLNYSLTQKPSWITVSSGGIVSGMPQGINVGDSVVTVKVGDGHGGLINQTYHLKVIHTNHNPLFVSVPDSVVTEDSLYRYAAVAQDQDSALFGDRVRYKLSVKPSWITIDSVAGTLTGLPSGTNARDTIVRIQAYDNNGGVSAQQFVLHVIHTNHAPQFISVPADSAVEDSLYYSIAGAADQDSLMWGDKDYFGIAQSPSWLSIDSLKGIIQGVPNLEGITSPSASLAAQRTNARVTQILNKAKAIKFYSVKSKMKVAPISGIKTDNTSRDFPVTIAVWDDKGGASEYSFNLTVRHTNHAPVIVLFPDSTATEDSLYTAAIRASDIDSAQFGDVVHYRCASKPHWISIDSVTGVISGTPRGSDLVDSTTMIVQAYDGKGGVTSFRYGIHIRHVNHPPVFVSVPPISGVEDSSYFYRAIATDPDTSLFGDKIRYAIITAPNFLTIDSASGILGGIPSLVVDSLSTRSSRAAIGSKVRTSVIRNSVSKLIPTVSRSAKKTVSGVHAAFDSAQYRTFPVSLSASDGSGGVARQNYTLAILHTDHAPVFTSTPDSSAVEDSLYSSSYTIYDIDASFFGDSLTVTAPLLPTWMHHDPVQHTLTGIPYGRSAADTVMELTVSDNHGLSTTRHFALHVVNVNHPPLILPVRDTLARADSAYRIVIPAVDSDAVYGRDSLTFKLIAGPQWLHLVNDTLVGVPINANAGDSIITVAVIDKKGIIAQRTWKIVVIPVLLPPTPFQLVNLSHTDSLTIDYGKALTLTWQPSHGHDPGDTVRYAVKLWGGGVDTTISGLYDTLYSSLAMMKKLSVRTSYRWTVSAMINGGKSTWSRDTIYFVTTGTILSSNGQHPIMPKDYIVYQNYPNPFNPATTIRYGIPEPSKVSIKVYNILGQLMATLVNETQEPQFYEYRWSPQNFSSGVYIIVVNAESILSSSKRFQNIKKALYLK